jgi:hypothetical protein
MVGARLDCAEWFQLYGGYIFRAYSTGETTERFDVPKEMRSHIKQRLEQITTSLEQRKDSSKPKPPDAQLGRWLEPPDNPTLKLLVPPLRLSDDQWERAVLLASKLLHAARRRPYLVSGAVLGYCYAATTHRHVIMTDEKDAEYGKLVFELVKELDLDQLGVRLVGFRAGPQQTDVEGRRLALQLPPAKADYETTNNLDSPARLNHIGIKVCFGDSGRASPEWHQVAFLATITELWRSVSRPNGFDRPA